MYRKERTGTTRIRKRNENMTVPVKDIKLLCDPNIARMQPLKLLIGSGENAEIVTVSRVALLKNEAILYGVRKSA